MRKKIDQIKDTGYNLYKKAEPTLTTITHKTTDAVKFVKKSDEARRLTQAVKDSPQAMQAIGVAAFSAAVTASTRITNYVACETDSCTTSITSTFLTTAAVAGGALYAAQRYGLFGKKPTAPEGTAVHTKAADETTEQPKSPLGR